MSTQIEKAFAEQYQANIQHLAQQQESRFAGKVREETQKGKTKFFDQLGNTAAVKRTTRHADTPRVDSKHARRAVYLNDYEWADLIDKQDEIRMLADPKSAYAQSAVFAMNRAKDQEVIAAATGNSYALLVDDDDGPTAAVALPAEQKIGVQFGSGTTPANTGLTLAKLIEAKSILGKNEYPAGSKLFIAVSQQQIDDLLLNVQQVSSADYASVKALVDGAVNYFMGMEFIKTELLALASETDVRTCFAYVQNALVLSVGAPIVGKITERPDKSYATQVYAAQSIGATRLEEKMVVEIACDETP